MISIIQVGDRMTPKGQYDFFFLIETTLSEIAKVFINRIPQKEWSDC